MEEQKVENDTGGTKEIIEQGTVELTQVKKTHDFETLYYFTYDHMLDRMKKDLISLQLTANDLAISLRSKRNIIEDEFKKNIRSKE